jgi:iron complex transport system ATP-binding protein
MIRLSGLAVEQRLQALDLSFQDGQLIGLIGPNGAGKSTLLQALGGLLPYQGEFSIDQRNLADLSSNERARLVALQPQFTEVIWSLSVHDIVSMGRLPWGDSDQQAIHSAMQLADGESLAERPVNQLSGGERSRVWLARVLANQPRLLLADEPVASLDLHYQQQVMQILRAYAQQGHAVLLAIHDLGLAARYCDGLCLLDGGRMQRSGSISEVLDPDLLSAVFAQQVYVDLENQPPIVMAH